MTVLSDMGTHPATSRIRPFDLTSQKAPTMTMFGSFGRASRLVGARFAHAKTGQLVTVPAYKVRMHAEAAHGGCPCVARARLAHPWRDTGRFSWAAVSALRSRMPQPFWVRELHSKLDER